MDQKGKIEKMLLETRVQLDKLDKLILEHTYSDIEEPIRTKHRSIGIGVKGLEQHLKHICKNDIK